MFNDYPKHDFSWVLSNLFERLDSTFTEHKHPWKTCNYTLVYYPKSLLVYIKRIRRNQLYLFS